MIFRIGLLTVACFECRLDKLWHRGEVMFSLDAVVRELTKQCNTRYKENCAHTDNVSNQDLMPEAWAPESQKRTMYDYVRIPVQSHAALGGCVFNQHQRDVSVTGLIDRLGWCPILERCPEARLCMFYKSLHGAAACPIPAYIYLATTATRASHNQQYPIPTAGLDA